MTKGRDQHPRRKTRLRKDRGRPLHRLRQVRLSQGISVRTLARRMKRKASEIRTQEDEFADITLSELFRWQQELKVPLLELLTEPDVQLSESVQLRASLLRIVKTVKSLLGQGTDSSTRRLAQNILDQLLSMMPELKEVTSWEKDATGARRARSVSKNGGSR